MAPSRESVEEFLTSYGRALATFDAVATTQLWGLPGTLVTDAFVGALTTREEMMLGLSQGHPVYRALGLGGATHTLLEYAPLTDALVRIRVRWHFLDDAGAELTDSDYEYLLRRDPEGLRAYVAVGINDAEKLRELAQRRGVELPGS
ncbi:hypothetical protein [Rhodococcus sp. NPDC004095]